MIRKPVVLTVFSVSALLGHGALLPIKPIHKLLHTPIDRRLIVPAVSSEKPLSMGLPVLAKSGLGDMALEMRQRRTLETSA